jgi:hypothetical protein
MYKLGGWDSIAPELKRINHGILTDPHYLSLFIGESIIATIRQLAFNEIGHGDFGLTDENSPGYWAVKHHLDWELEHLHSTRFTQGVPKMLADLAHNQNILVMGCLLLMALFLFHPRADKTMNSISMICLLFVLGNAFCCGALACIAPRYTARLLWIFIPQAMVLLYANRLLVAQYFKAIQNYIRHS